MPGCDPAGRGRELECIFGIDAALDRMAGELDFALAIAQLFACRNVNLLLHDVDAGDHFCHRMLNLDPGIHFNEIKFAFFIQEFKGAGAAVTDLAASFSAAFADFFDDFARDADCRCFFDHFLVPALHRTIALAEPDRILEFVCQYLDFHMARIFQKLLHIDFRIAESCAGFGLGHGDCIQQCGFGMHHAHAAPAAATGGLDDDRIADLARGLDDDLGIVRQCAFRTGYARHACLDHGLLGRDLVAHQANRFRARSDEDEPGLLHPFGKVGVFGQETVAGMNCLSIGDFGSADDCRHAQVACRGRRRADTDRFIGQFDVFCFAVGFGMHDDCLDAHFAAGALDAERDFTTIGDEDFFKHRDVNSRGLEG